MTEVNLDRFRKCIKLCQEHFGGAWKKVNTDDDNEVQSICKPISGGFNNFLYAVCLPGHLSPKYSEPSSVMLRFYGQANGDHYAMLRDSVVFALLSERGLGPRLYGCFAGGRFEEYIPTTCLETREQSNPEYSRHIASHMAKFHLLEMPLSKEPKYLRQNIHQYLDGVLRNVDYLKTNYTDQWQEFESLGIDLQTETEWLLNLLYSFGSPVRFCHNDVHEGNLLKNPGGDGLVVIDFEYSAYNFRGFDVANHFAEWCYCYAVSEPPYFTENLDHYPTPEQQTVFYKAYLAACDIPHEEIEDQMEKLRSEVMVFSLGVHYLWALWSTFTASNPVITFDYMCFALARFRKYLDCKRNLQENYPHLLIIKAKNSISDKTTPQTIHVDIPSRS